MLQYTTYIYLSPLCQLPWFRDVVAAFDMPASLSVPLGLRTPERQVAEQEKVKAFNTSEECAQAEIKSTSVLLQPG